MNKDEDACRTNQGFMDQREVFRGLLAKPGPLSREQTGVALPRITKEPLNA